MMRNIKESMTPENEQDYKPKIKEIEKTYYMTLQDIRSKVLQNLKVIKEGQADTANQAFEKFLKEERQKKGSEIGQALQDIEEAIKAAIGVGGDMDSINVTQILNIEVENVEKDVYEDMICKFYSAINHKMYMGVKRLREEQA